MTTPHLTAQAAFVARFNLGAATGVELGPFDRPVFSRSAFPGVLYADVKDTAELRRLAATRPQRNPDNVVPVDFVLLDRPLDAVIPHGSMDFVFCSHVLEHVPDLIGMLQSVGRVLRPGGLFLIAYPDRRFTFDIDRPRTTVDQLRDRHARRITRPDPDTVREHMALCRQVHVGRLWQGLPDATGPRLFSAEHADKMALRARTAYVDVHCNVFADHEFAATVNGLAAEGLHPLGVADLVPTASPLNEFFVALRHGGADHPA